MVLDACGDEVLGPWPEPTDSTAIHLGSGAVGVIATVVRVDIYAEVSVSRLHPLPIKPLLSVVA